MFTSQDGIYMRDVAELILLFQGYLIYLSVYLRLFLII